MMISVESRKWCEKDEKNLERKRRSCVGMYTCEKRKKKVVNLVIGARIEDLLG